MKARAGVDRPQGQKPRCRVQLCARGALARARGRRVRARRSRRVLLGPQQGSRLRPARCARARGRSDLSPVEAWIAEEEPPVVRLPRGDIDRREPGKSGMMPPSSTRRPTPTGESVSGACVCSLRSARTVLGSGVSNDGIGLSTRREQSACRIASAPRARGEDALCTDYVGGRSSRRAPRRTVRIDENDRGLHESCVRSGVSGTTEPGSKLRVDPIAPHWRAPDIRSARTADRGLIGLLSRVGSGLLG